jgi:ribosomal protein S11
MIHGQQDIKKNYYYIYDNNNNKVIRITDLNKQNYFWTALDWYQII